MTSFLGKKNIRDGREHKLVYAEDNGWNPFACNSWSLEDSS